MDESSRIRAEDWLRYADDLSLGPYYLSRTTQLAATPGASASSSQVADASVEPSIAAVSNLRLAVAATASLSSPAPMTAPRPTSGFVPPVAAASLFEERVENDSLERIREDIGPNCMRCKLHKARTQIVFGVGNPKAQLVFIGEGPGRDEDIQGEPFVGRAGKLLTQMIEAMGLRRPDVYICNVVKCRPPENRLPENDEIGTCSPFLLRQLGVIQPKVICCLGACSAQTLLQTNQGISRFRGEWFDYRGSKLIATYHPAYLLRNPAAKGEVWKDLQKVMVVLGLEPKKR